MTLEKFNYALLVNIVVFFMGAAIGSEFNKVNHNAIVDHKGIDSLTKVNDSIKIKVEHLDSIKDAKVIEVSHLDNDSTVKLFYKLVSE